MKFSNLTKERAITYHLTLYSKYDENTTVFSSLIALLRDSRLITGRNIDNGQRSETLKKRDRSDSWLGAIGYLIVLDQIGKCYRPKSNVKIIQGNSITKALKYFTSLNDKQIKAIYALRCAFIHDYSLFNIGKGGLTHHFTVSGHGYRKLIKLPQIQWDGDHNSKTVNNMTVINLPLLSDLIERIFESIKLYFKDNKLDLEISPEELKNRYLLFERAPKQTV